MTTSVRIAYFDCFSGASGDMLLGTLIDAGWGGSVLRTIRDGDTVFLDQLVMDGSSRSSSNSPRWIPGPPPASSPRYGPGRSPSPTTSWLPPTCSTLQHFWH